MRRNNRNTVMVVMNNRKPGVKRFRGSREIVVGSGSKGFVDFSNARTEKFHPRPIETERTKYWR